MKKLITTVLALALSQNAFALNDYLNESALELEALYGQVADTMSKAYLNNGACEADVYMQEIADAARESRRYHDNNYNYNLNTGDRFTLSASTLQVLKTTLALKDIMSMLDYRDPSTFEHALNRVVMWGPAPGAYGHSSKMEFGQNNTVTFYTKELLDEAPYVTWNTKQGSFFVEKTNDGKIVVVLNANNESAVERFELYFDWQYKTWMMKPLGFEGANPFIHGYTDYPDECSA